ncbi:hypothetical protein UNSW3_300 [Campylobacter concisus UNSW3]|uniref:Uncharacterized protein n=1 Tax=Campylobacter concisus UNSW3 TaxID=1242966 RepID=U2G8F0_9BACT|nr:hypothetical protein UNSW3_300 [Campylobacter concisus UNSW3]
MGIDAINFSKRKSFKGYICYKFFQRKAVQTRPYTLKYGKTLYKNIKFYLYLLVLWLRK